MSIKDLFSRMMKKKKFGVPVPFLALGGVFVGIPLIRKFMKKK
jgi:hypothetical protein